MSTLSHIARAAISCGLLALFTSGQAFACAMYVEDDEAPLMTLMEEIDDQLDQAAEIAAEVQLATLVEIGEALADAQANKADVVDETAPAPAPQQQALLPSSSETPPQS